jgi:hypothetical protein
MGVGLPLGEESARSPRKGLQRLWILALGGGGVWRQLLPSLLDVSSIITRSIYFQ